MARSRSGAGSGSVQIITDPDRKGPRINGFTEHCFFPSFVNFISDWTGVGVQMLGTTGSILFELQFNYEIGTAFSYNGSEIEAPLKVDAVILVHYFKYFCFTLGRLL
jgi:hypothetical protein